ncbi:FHA domain-containing protein [Myxococcus sp. K15C18031901]|uniref:FHA domain-containing protein n=1 Tax=Myxococcus dinghuensis TaxID=2906761 RepID=UPI0020A80C1A|nr:FHA domain-containing protein [Myxococcus dinghuensis]MCP3103199.1 FHA domain-containing protein [Myxococcus dinghuensis]
MRFEFEHLGTTTPFELSEGHHQLGGGPDDHVRLEALPPGLLSLRIESQRLMVEATRTFAVDGVLVPQGVARLVLPGEVLGLPDDMCLRVLAETTEERTQGTLAILKGLLTGLEDSAPSRAATLTCLTGLDVGRVHALADARTQLGRGSEATLRLRDRAVSRNHACIVQDSARFLLEDLGSPNGVYLNGQRLQEPTALSDGDVIELGRTLLRFQAALEEPPPPPPTPDGGVLPPPDGEVSPAEPAASEQEPSSTAPRADAVSTPAEAPRTRLEWWLLGLGVAAALVGLLVTYALATA